VAHPPGERRHDLNPALLERAVALRSTNQPFVLATVVRSVRPASAKPGASAIFASGTLDGWVGGGCVQTCIETEARHALADGRPRLVRLSPDVDPARAGAEEEGILSYPMTCHSGGTLEIYLEPVLPPPDLVVLGDSPVAQGLVALAAPLGFRATLHSDPEDALQLAEPADSWVVIAGMGDRDDLAVKAALESGAAYVAVVASRKRAAAIVEALRTDGVSPELLARLKAPAGLDIGAQTGPEIALSILAEIVERRRASAPLREHAQYTPATATDPVCGMQVEIATARWTAVKDGQTYYFCAPGCKRQFEQGHTV
jgi:xanthine dehydrogenase accessory factor